MDHLGIRVPIRAIVERIRQTSPNQFVLIDAAQAFCHVPIDESVAVADFVVTGCHKWMRAGQPMGIGLFGQHHSRPLITDTLHKLSNTGSDLDPLLQFTEQIAGSVLNGHSETVNLSPLFSCNAAAVCHRENNAACEVTRHEHWDSRIHHIPDSLSHWVPVLTHRTLRSRISLFTTTEPKIRTNPVEHARREWLKHGCVVTAYDNGLVRVSPPISSPAAITENRHIADD